MSDDPIGNGNAPATQDDLQIWGGRLTERIDGLGQRLESFESDTKQELSGLRQLIEKSLRIQESTLTTLNSVEGRLKEMADYEERIVRLEDAVLGG